MLPRADLRKKYFNNSQQKCNSPSLWPKENPDDLSVMVQQLLPEKPEYEAFAEALSKLLANQVDPDLWGPQPWPAWKWATVLIATDWAVERIRSCG